MGIGFSKKIINEKRGSIGTIKKGKIIGYSWWMIWDWWIWFNIKIIYWWGLVIFVWLIEDKMSIE